MLWPIISSQHEGRSVVTVVIICICKPRSQSGSKVNATKEEKALLVTTQSSMCGVSVMYTTRWVNLVVDNHFHSHQSHSKVGDQVKITREMKKRERGKERERERERESPVKANYMDTGDIVANTLYLHT